MRAPASDSNDRTRALSWRPFISVDVLRNKKITHRDGSSLLLDRPRRNPDAFCPAVLVCRPLNSGFHVPSYFASIPLGSAAEFKIPTEPFQSRSRLVLTTRRLPRSALRANLRDESVVMNAFPNEIFNQEDNRDAWNRIGSNALLLADQTNPFIPDSNDQSDDHILCRP